MFNLNEPLIIEKTDLYPRPFGTGFYGLMDKKSLENTLTNNSVTKKERNSKHATLCKHPQTPKTSVTFRNEDL